VYATYYLLISANFISNLNCVRGVAIDWCKSYFSLPLVHNNYLRENACKYIVLSRPTKKPAVTYRLMQLQKKTMPFGTSATVKARRGQTDRRNFDDNASLDHLAVTDVTICLVQATIHPPDCVRNLGVLLDSSLSTRQHIAKIASTCFFHCRLRKLHRVLDLESRKRLVCAFILTRID